ncbi:MAG TPA: ATP-binding protein [Solirubrobacteraceae bacterium]|nr:ATP-binding protein [Solirubrobacteraceae bacterium]
MTRIPIRLRLTLAFTAVMAVLLCATGLFLHLRLGAELDATIDRGLRSRAGDVTALVEQADSGLAESGRSPLTEQGQNLAQILDAFGRVVDAPPALRGRPLLTSSDIARALRGTITVSHSRPGDEDNASRLLATPVRAQGQRLLVVVGASLEDRNEAVSNLGALLLIGGPAALLLASLAGYGLAAAALRPVESMRRRASEIQSTEPGRRLPVSPAPDEISRLGDTLNEMLARLEVALTRERTFVSDASHELRTPLAILKTELELARRGERSKAELQDALGSAAEETERLAQLAEDLLVIARSDQGRLPIRLEKLEVAAVLAEVRERYARRAAERNAELVVEVPGRLCVTADPLRLEQALGNLVDNALRHGDGGRIVLNARERNGCIELHVRDRGRGFPEPFIVSAFERFTRGDQARVRGGAGLGLAIVAAIAAAHHGEVGASNQPDGGADVWMAIPG